jgi:hypothetical protein
VCGSTLESNTIARSPHKNCLLPRLTICSTGAQTEQDDQVNAMASSMRHDLHSQPVPEDDVTMAKEERTLDLGHDGLRPVRRVLATG